MKLEGFKKFKGDAVILEKFDVELAINLSKTDCFQWGVSYKGQIILGRTNDDFTKMVEFALKKEEALHQKYLELQQKQEEMYNKYFTELENFEKNGRKTIRKVIGVDLDRINGELNQYSHCCTSFHYKINLALTIVSKFEDEICFAIELIDNHPDIFNIA